MTPPSHWQSSVGESDIAMTREPDLASRPWRHLSIRQRGYSEVACDHPDYAAFHRRARRFENPGVGQLLTGQRYSHMFVHVVADTGVQCHVAVDPERCNRTRVGRSIIREARLPPALQVEFEPLRTIAQPCIDDVGGRTVDIG